VLDQNKGGLLRSTSKFIHSSVTSSADSTTSVNKTLHRSQKNIMAGIEAIDDANDVNQPNLKCSLLQQRSPDLVVSFDILNKRCEELFGGTEPGATVRFQKKEFSK